MHTRQETNSRRDCIIRKSERHTADLLITEMNPVMIEKREKIWSGFAGHQYISAGLHSAGPRNGGIRYYLAVLAGRDRDIDIFT